MAGADSNRLAYNFTRMKLTLNENSLFAILLRSSWWISAALAVAVFIVARFFLPTVYAAFVPLPFAVIAAVVAWRQLRAPSSRKVAARLNALRALPREEFSAALSAAFRRQGYEVHAGRDGELELSRAGRTSLVDCRRWKATRTGIEPLRELHAAAQARKADECIYVAAGEVTDTARAFAARNQVRLMTEKDLVEILP
jgi:restriction system protein